MYTRGAHLWEKCKCKCKRTAKETSNFRGKHPTEVLQAKSEHFLETVMFLGHIVLLLQKKQKKSWQKSPEHTWQISVDHVRLNPIKCRSVPWMQESGLREVWLKQLQPLHFISIMHGQQYLQPFTRMKIYLWMYSHTSYQSPWRV